MKKGKFLLLGAGYVAGVLMALRFGKNGKGKTWDTLVEEFKNVHKNLFSEAEEALFSEENKERIRELKGKILEEVAIFEKEAKVKIEELLVTGKGKKSDIEDELKGLYARREAIIAEMKKKTVALFEKNKDNGTEMVEQLKDKIEEVYWEVLHELEDAYNRLKKKIK